MYTSNNYTMITNTIADLLQRGFTADFILIDSRLFCKQTLCFFNANEFDIREVHSFENEHPGNDQIVVYAIECLANTVKGVLFQNPGAINREEVILTKLRKFLR